MSEPNQNRSASNLAICSPNQRAVALGSGIPAGVGTDSGSIGGSLSASSKAGAWPVRAGVGVAIGSGVVIVVRLFSLVSLELVETAASEFPLELCEPEVAALLVVVTSVGSGTGRKAKNSPPAISAKITAPMIMAPELGLLPSSRAIIGGRRDKRATADKKQSRCRRRSQNAKCAAEKSAARQSAS